MAKATLRSAVLLALLAIGMAATAMPSYAETQNVKVGGDITVRAFHRSNLDLHQEDDNSTCTLGVCTSNNTLDGQDDFFMQTTGINISADLTENVRTFVRLANESDWGTLGGSAAGGDFDISQGYVQLKDLFYAPLTVTIGRQPIVWGRGFIIGGTLIPDVFENGDRNGSIAANEFTDFTAFDAVRATLDFSGAAAVSLPLSVDLMYSKLREGTIGNPDDKNLLGINIGTKTDMAEVETYFVNMNDKSPTATGVANNADSSINTLGLRGSVKPIEGTNFYGELAYQWGTRNTDINGGGLVSGDNQQGWALDLGAEVGFKDVPTSPMIGAEWILYTGKDIGAQGGAQGWMPIAPSYFTTAIRQFQTAGASGFYGTDQAGDTGSASNQHQFSLYGSLKPLEDLTIAPRVSLFFLEDGVYTVGVDSVRSNSKKHYAGLEWDTVATYNYTDDVQFGLIYGVFAPGTVYNTPNQSVAQELVSSVSVKF